jgi:hypothetical protein
MNQQVFDLQGNCLKIRSTIHPLASTHDEFAAPRNTRSGPVKFLLRSIAGKHAGSRGDIGWAEGRA